MAIDFCRASGPPPLTPIDFRHYYAATLIDDIAITLPAMP